MKKLLLLNLIFLFASTSLFSQNAALPAGSGTAEDPYRIANLDNLYWIASNSANWGFHYIQTANIDASVTTGWFSGAGWTPIGNFDGNFTGSYDGQGFIIESIFIDRSIDDIGLFGYIGSSGVIKNLGLTNLNIVGTNYCGGLAGNNDGSVDKCYTTGKVSGTSYTGGLIGESFAGSITRCYSSATVSGTSYVGGFIGANHKNISYSYSSGSVTAGTRYFGGFCGFNTDIISFSFWDTETSKQTTSAGGTGLTTAEMQYKPTFTNAGWDFIETWAIHSSANGGYPFLPSWVKWEGGVSADWGAGTNWSTGSVPGANDYISITSKANKPQISVATTVNYLVVGDGAELTVQSGGITINSGGKLTLSPGARMTAVGSLVNNAGTGGLVVESNATASGSVIQNSSGVDATVQGYVTGAQWHIISSPVSGQSINGFLTNAENNISFNSTGEYYAMTHYEENRYTGSGGWGSYYTGATSGNMEMGKGYLARRGDSNPLSFAGQLPYSDVSILITREGHGWNAIGNPFSSAIGITTDAVTASNFLDHNAGQLDGTYGAIYIYDPGANGYTLINNVEGSQTHLPAGQGFIVKSKIDGGIINFSTGMRIHDNTSKLKNASYSPWYRVRLKVSSENRSANTLIAFNSYMTRGLDPTYDGGEFGADPGYRLYTRLLEDDNDINIAIQALPDNFDEDMVIPVGFDFSEGGEVTFSAEELSLPEGVSAILEDRLLDEFTDLTKNNYTVSLDQNSTGPGRFFVHTGILITDVDETPEISVEKQIMIYAFDREVFIIGEAGKNSYATLVDLMGRTVKKVKLENSERNSFRVDELAQGVYLVRVSGSGNISKRIYID